MSDTIRLPIAPPARTVRAASALRLSLEVMGQEGILTGAGVVRLERAVEHLERDLGRLGREAPA